MGKVMKFGYIDTGESEIRGIYRSSWLEMPKVGEEVTAQDADTGKVKRAVVTEVNEKEHTYSARIEEDSTPADRKSTGHATLSASHPETVRKMREGEAEIGGNDA